MIGPNAKIMRETMTVLKSARGLPVISEGLASQFFCKCHFFLLEIIPWPKFLPFYNVSFYQLIISL